MKTGSQKKARAQHERSLNARHVGPTPRIDLILTVVLRLYGCVPGPDRSEPWSTAIILAVTSAEFWFSALWARDVRVDPLHGGPIALYDLHSRGHDSKWRHTAIEPRPNTRTRDLVDSPLNVAPGMNKGPKGICKIRSFLHINVQRQNDQQNYLVLRKNAPPEIIPRPEQYQGPSYLPRT